MDDLERVIAEACVDWCDGRRFAVEFSPTVLEPYCRIQLLLGYYGEVLYAVACRSGGNAAAQRLIDIVEESMQAELSRDALLFRLAPLCADVGCRSSHRRLAAARYARNRMGSTLRLDPAAAVNWKRLSASVGAVLTITLDGLTADDQRLTRSALANMDVDYLLGRRFDSRRESAETAMDAFRAACFTSPSVGT
jgi:hypothetical protein